MNRADDCRFHTDACVTLPASVQARGACDCARHGRRQFPRLLAGAAAVAAAPAALAQPVAECKRSGFTKAVSADQIEGAARQEYRNMLQQAGQQKALAPMEHPQLQRLRYIADRITPFTLDCNPRAEQWKWEVNLIGSKELNAFCMPGGKIAFYWGILAQLQLNDDEVATIMGHEIAHALLEHARERMGKTMVTRGAIEIGAALFGLGDLGRAAAGIGGQLLTLKFSREDESEADSLGLILSARAGYDPAAGVTLWQKMMAASKGAPPQFMSTHPSSETRISDIQARLPRLTPVFQAAGKPARRFAAPELKKG